MAGLKVVAALLGTALLIPSTARRKDRTAFAQSGEGEPPGEPSACAGSAGASPSRNNAGPFG